MGIGCPEPTTGNNDISLDFIEFFSKKSKSLCEIVGPLYRQGLSISDIADQTGLKRHSIWKALKANKEHLRNQTPVPFERWRQGHGKMNARPPFGYCYFQGEIIRDPKEYPTLLLIRSLWKQGMSISSIVRDLDGKRIQSRMKKPWSYNVIKATIGRFERGIYEKLDSDKNSKNTKRRNKGVKS